MQEDRRLCVRRQATAETVRVLVAEADVDEANATIDAIGREQRGMRVEATPSGERALDLLEARSFDCLVLGSDLPHLGGLEVVHRLRERGDETPVVVRTDRDAEPLERRFREEGVAAYLHKRRSGGERLRREVEDAVEG